MRKMCNLSLLRQEGRPRRPFIRLTKAACSGISKPERRVAMRSLRR